MHLFQSLKCAYLLFSHVFYDSKLDILRFLSVGQKKQLINKQEIRICSLRPQSWAFNQLLKKTIVRPIEN